MKAHIHKPRHSQALDDSIKAVDNAPTIDELPSVDGLTALAASFRFMDNNPNVRERVDSLIIARSKEIIAELEKDPETEMYLVSERNIRAIFSKAVFETAGTIALGMSNTLAKEETLQHQFSSARPERETSVPDATPELQGGV